MRDPSLEFLKTFKHKRLAEPFYTVLFWAVEHENCIHFGHKRNCTNVKKKHRKLKRHWTETPKLRVYFILFDPKRLWKYCTFHTSLTK